MEFYLCGTYGYTVSSNLERFQEMFLDSGDGVVFKGAIGPWYNPKRGEFHLSREAAREVVAMAIESYVARVGQPPAELFLHGKVRFNDEEWRGFIEAPNQRFRCFQIFLGIA
jgi:hypothetical protein